MICGNKWLDFEGIYNVRFEEGKIIVKNKGEKNVCFNSIGELNIVSGQQNISLKPRPPQGWDERDTSEFNSPQQAIFWIFIYALWICFLVATIKMKGTRNKSIQLFNIFQCFIGIVAGLGFMQFSYIIGFSTIFVGVAVFIEKKIYS